jgi:hypothetical protein
MHGLIQEPQFKHISIREIGTTFAAEIEGVDFSQDIPQEVFDEILAAITKVSTEFYLKYSLNLTIFLVWRPRIQRHRLRRHPTRRILQTFRRT